MNNTALLELFRNPVQLKRSESEEIEKVLQDYPYFQAAHAVHLKALHASKSYKYNQALKRTAAHTIDRNILFEFITSKAFYQNNDSKEIPMEEIEVIDVETIQDLHKKITENIQSSKENEESSALLDKLESQVSEMLEIGQPISFDKSEPHSFNEWMQLISKKPVDRKSEVDLAKEKQHKSSKYELIDKFIEANPKIGALDKSIKTADLTLYDTKENESLMTETLAKVYLEQRKFENAIKAYRILSLKYPEKSGFFADRIKAIKILQKNKA